jgi:hypothetical protein
MADTFLNSPQITGMGFGRFGIKMKLKYYQFLKKVK